MELNSELDRLQKYAPFDAELKRAEAKHPDYPVDMFRQLAIMQEEAGEVTKAVLDYLYEGGTLDHIREELIQTGAMCMRMLENLNKRPIVNSLKVFLHPDCMTVKSHEYHHNCAIVRFDRDCEDSVEFIQTVAVLGWVSENVRYTEEGNPYIDAYELTSFLKK